MFQLEEQIGAYQRIDRLQHDGLLCSVATGDASIGGNDCGSMNFVYRTVLKRLHTHLHRSGRGLPVDRQELWERIGTSCSQELRRHRSSYAMLPGGELKHGPSLFCVRQ